MRIPAQLLLATPFTLAVAVLPWARAEGLADTTPELSTQTEDWRSESADFIRRYYPNWKDLQNEDERYHVAFTITLDELEVQSDGLDFARSNELVRDTVLILSPEARERFLMTKHLDALDYNLFNRWTLPLLGSMSAEERAREKERYERFLALQDRTDQVIDFVSKRDPLLARQMNAELANNAPSELSDRDR